MVLPIAQMGILRLSKEEGMKIEGEKRTQSPLTDPELPWRWGQALPIPLSSGKA